ncbi:MAG TPA: sigma-70 family RNA polymerase sigma factor [Bryobacteraceae bacterium]|nr:sigma-70 family RNA polymerase sigma factor [Bryobacteraceae bacterium]
MSTRDEILSRLRRRLVSTLRPRFREKAEDIAHDTVAVLLEKYPNVEDEVQLLKLLYTIKRFVSLGAARKPAEDQFPEAFDSPDQRLGAEQELTENDKVDALESAIGQLGERCKRLFRYRLKEMETPEIATHLNVTINNLYQIEMRCTERLRAIMTGSRHTSEGKHA